MDCELVDPRLVGFHLGEADPGVEGHLLECRECLRSYLEIKRHEQNARALGWEPPPPRVRWRRRYWAIPVAAAAAASLLWFFSGTKPVSPSIPDAWAGTEPRSQSFF